MFTGPARACATLFALYILLQRIAVPGTPIAVLLPITLGWAVVVYRKGLVELDRTRTILFACAAATTGMVSVVQSSIGHAPVTSYTSWLLLFATWAPLVLRFKDRSTATYMSTLRAFSWVAVPLAVGSVVMMLSQLGGMPYFDVLSESLPAHLLVDGFNTNSPAAFESDLIKSNAWVGLEPSLVSLQLAAGLAAAVYCGQRLAVIVVIVAGMLCTLSGSGIVLAGLAFVFVSMSRARHLLRDVVRFLLPILLILAFLPLAATFVLRIQEFVTPGSSGSIRAVEPYEVLFPIWISTVDGVMLGFGPGSSQNLINNPGIDGLIVTIPIKALFDYGIIGGLVLLAFFLYCHATPPVWTLSLAMLLAYWSLQPAATLMLLVGQIGLLVTFWSPAPGTRLDSLHRAQWTAVQAPKGVSEVRVS